MLYSKWALLTSTNELAYQVPDFCTVVTFDLILSEDDGHFEGKRGPLKITICPSVIWLYGRPTGTSSVTPTIVQAYILLGNNLQLTGTDMYH